MPELALKSSPTLTMKYCIICNNNVPSTENYRATENSAWHLLKQNENKILLLNFCNYFHIKLPPTFLQCDLVQEDAFFCPNCSVKAEKLVTLNRMLEILKGELKELEIWLKSQIASISGTEGSIENKVKGWSCEDPTVETIRDIILGPCIKLRKLPLTSKNDPEMTPSEPLENSDGSEIGECPDLVSMNITDEVGLGCSHEKLVSFHEGSPEQIQNAASITEVIDRKEQVKDIKVEPDLTDFEDASEFWEEKAEDMETIETKAEEMERVGSDDDDDSVDLEDNENDSDFQLSDKDDLSNSSDEVGNIELKKTREKKGRPNSSGDQSTQFTTTLLGEDRFLYGIEGGNKLEYKGNDTDGYQCCQCTDGHVYRKRKHIRVHLRIHFMRNSGEVKCSICAQDFPSAFALKSHMETHFDNSAICEICGKGWKNKAALRGHRYQTHGKGSHPCDICDKTFKRISKLGRHKREVHLKIKTVFCEKCGKGFFDMRALRKHLLSASHSSEKFNCSECGQNFSSEWNRRKHIRKFHGGPSKDGGHEGEFTGDTDLKCKHCGRQYNRLANLNRHIFRIHHICVSPKRKKRSQSGQTKEEVLEKHIGLTSDNLKS